MDVRLDKVTRMLALGFKKVYSLVLNDQGLYIIQTGNVGALQHYDMRGVLNKAVAGAITNAFVKELEAGEARLASISLDQLAKEKNNAFIALSEIQSVIVKPGKSPEMKLKTGKGDFTFVFTHTPAAQVQALAQTLQR